MSKSKIITLPEFIESKSLVVETVHLLDIDENKIGTFLQVNRKKPPSPRDTGLDILFFNGVVRLFICKGTKVHMLSPEIDVFQSNSYERFSLLLCEFSKREDGSPVITFNEPGLFANQEQLHTAMSNIDWEDLTPFRKALLEYVLNNIHRTKWVFALKATIAQAWT